MSDWLTKRLRIRRFTSADATFVLEVHQSAALRRFIPSAALDTHEQARRRVRDFEASASPGRGWWCVTRRVDGLAVGALLLQPAPPSRGSPVDDIEVGWRAHPAYVGHGYTTEAAATAMATALTDSMPRVIALVDPSNAASIRLCERLQMTDLGRTRDYYDENLRLFEARRAL